MSQEPAEKLDTQLCLLSQGRSCGCLVCAASVRAPQGGRHPQPETWLGCQVCLGAADCLACWGAWTHA